MPSGAVDRFDDARHTGQCKRVAFDRDDDSVACDEWSERQVAESRWRVDQDEVPIVRQPGEGANDGEPSLVRAALARRNQAEAGRDEVHTGCRGGHHQLRDPDPARRELDEPGGRLAPAEPCCCRPLRVEVDHEDAEAALGEGGSEVYRRGRLAAAALVV